MNNRDKSRKNFEGWWKNYHQGQGGEELAWQAWEFGRREGYQNGWADANYLRNVGGKKNNSPDK